MAKPKIKMVCPKDEAHDIIDHDKSNENWIVYKNECPVCKSKAIFNN